MSQPSVFLSARWENLVMINYEVDPAILIPHLPPFTELDLFEGKALVSVVGFMFRQTKVMGISWPLHSTFEEVNLRYYIKHFDGNQWKRGVGFISEIVPKPMISIIANMLYNEHYSTARMKHKITSTEKEITVCYDWKKLSTGWNRMKLTAEKNTLPLEPGTEAWFILEHYWGYNKLNNRTTIEYAVEHPTWQIHPVKTFELNADITKLYGRQFSPFIKNITPHSVFLAKGSAVVVRKPIKIKAKNT
ncbi:MAG: DUF2071 domain-containing protein [Ferruginibacter sp.]